MSKRMFPLVHLTIFLLLLNSCALSAVPSPTPTPTLSPTVPPTSTLTPTLTATAVPTSTATVTATATATSVPLETSDSVKDRETFEKMAESGEAKCQGYKSGDMAVINKFVKDAKSSGMLPDMDMLLVAGIPSTQNPQKCLFILYFEDDYSYIIFKQSNTGKFVRLLLLD